MVNPATKRRAIKFVEEEGLGTTSQACRAFGLSRSGYYRTSTVSLKSRELHQEIRELSSKHPRYGYRRIMALMRRGGVRVNSKRVQRIRNQKTGRASSE